MQDCFGAAVTFRCFRPFRAEETTPNWSAGVAMVILVINPNNNNMK